MSLLSKIERLEKFASTKATKRVESDPELLADMGRIVREIVERGQRETIPEKAARLREDIAELREEIEHYQTPKDPLYAMLNTPEWLQAKLGVFEQALAQLERLS